MILYPNPADNHISIALNMTNDAPVVVSIFDIQGKKMKEQLLPSGSNIDINIPELPRGVYMVKVNHSITREILGSARFLKL